jgi:flagellar hook protein FlgE
MGSFSVPLTGLKAAQAQLQAVSNNLSNSGTAGYKDTTLTFSSIFSSAGTRNGSGDPIQVGSGVQTAASDIDFTQGNVNATGNASNMAISGNGFFVTQDSLGNNAYTRAGDFKTDTTGQLIAPNGQLLLGYPAVNGTVNKAGTLGPLQVGSGNSAAVATTNFSITANLDARAAAGDTASSTLSVHDSLGAEHALDVTYTKTAAGVWNYSISVPNSDLSTGGTGTSTVATGTLNFDSAGKLVMSGTPPATTLAVAIPSSAMTGVTFANGAAPLTMNWKLADSAGNPTITQTATTSSTSTTSQDGFASGSLQSYSILADGTVEGAFSSGQSMALGQVAIASFANTQGLLNNGATFSATVASGDATIGVAGTGDRGTVIGGSIEQSNVDIAAEFAKLIVAQQAYSANAKAVTTFTQVSQATMAMVQ